jgi:hypothetical protein
VNGVSITFDKETKHDSPFTRPCMLAVDTAVQNDLMGEQRGEAANAIGTAVWQTPERSNPADARGRLAAGLGTLTRSLRPSAAGQLD